MNFEKFCRCPLGILHQTKCVMTKTKKSKKKLSEPFMSICQSRSVDSKSLKEVKMRLLPLIVISTLIFPLLFGILNIAEGQSESEDYTIKHLKTIKMNFSNNYYSYNFVFYPKQQIIDSVKIAVISDIETKYATTNNDIIPGDWVSFGIMVNAEKPENIMVEVVEIKLKS